MNTKSVGMLVGILTGFTVGIAVGMAVAPRPGMETREKIANRVKWQFLSPRERYLYLWKRTCGV
jgi:gas vesicle protein